MSQIDAATFLNPQSNQKEILLADLQAAKWIEKIQVMTDLEKLAEHFIFYHHHLTQSIMGTTVSRLEQVDKQRLGEIIQRWATLYSVALDQLKIHFPAHSAPDLMINGKNWTETLQINAVGLMRLANESRYAEYWAEKSLSDSAIYDSYSERLDFLTTEAHWQLSQVKLTESLALFDAANLGVTTYDIARAIYDAPDSDFVEQFQSLGWQVHRFEPEANQVCLLLYEVLRSFSDR